MKAQERSPRADTRPRDRLPTFPRNSQHSFPLYFSLPIEKFSPMSALAARKEDAIDSAQRLRL